MKIKNLVSLVCFIAGFCLGVPIYAQKAWEKKPYQQWSDDEARQILTNSPWAQTKNILPDNPSSPIEAAFSTLRATVRLQSALPVRQALVRQKLLSVKYDKLSLTDRAKYDAQAKEVIECSDCANYYIIALNARPALPLGKSTPEKVPLDVLQEHVFLATDKGEARNLFQVKYENQEILYYFKRLDDHGKPLISADDKEFYFELAGKVSNGNLKLNKYFTFKVAKLTHNGEIVF